MKKTLALIATAVVIAASNVSAATITRLDSTYGGSGGASVLLNSSNPSVSGAFDIDPPFNPAADLITSATLTFYYYDDRDRRDSEDEYVSISLDLTPWFSEEVGSSDSNSEFNTLTGTFLASLQADGILNYRVSRTAGDFYYDGAKLVVNYAQGVKPHSTPDGGATLAFLGMGFVGLAFLKRKVS